MKLFLFEILLVGYLYWEFVLKTKKAQNYKVAYLKLMIEGIKKDAFEVGVRWAETPPEDRYPRDIEDCYGMVYYHVLNEEIDELLKERNVKIKFKQKKREALIRDALTYRDY